MPDNTKVSFGATSWIGYLASALVAVKLGIHSIEVGNLEATASGSNKWLAIFATVMLAVTTFVRGWQAQAKVGGGAAELPPDVELGVDRIDEPAPEPPAATAVDTASTK